MTEDHYVDLVNKIYQLIAAEIERAERASDLAEIYPKLVTMYQFFSYLRGEAFHNIRPVTPGKQNEFYKLEDSLLDRILKLKEKLDLSDKRVQYYIQMLGKPYFE